MPSIDTCVQQLAEFVSNSDPHISGPHEIAYGMGWAPSVSYWIGQRRVHLYEDLCAKTKPEPFAVEIADIGDKSNRIVRRCHVTNIDQIRDIMDRFLCQNLSANDLTEYNWIADNLDSDKSIPDPPNRDNPANFAGLVGAHIAPNGPPQIDPTVRSRKPWWKLW